MNKKEINVLLDSEIYDENAEIKIDAEQIKIDAERYPGIEKREINGKTYLMIPLPDTSDFEVNGVRYKVKVGVSL